MPLLNLHAQQFINLSSRLSCRKLMRVKHHSRYSHQSADVDSLPSGSRNLCDAQHVYDKWSSRAVVHKHSSPSCSYFKYVSFCKKQDACSPTWQHHYLIHHIILSQLFWRSMLCIIGLTCCVAVTETSLVDSRDDSYQAFASLLIISPYNRFMGWRHGNHFIKHFK